VDGSELPKSDCRQASSNLDFAVIFLRLEKSRGKVNKRVSEGVITKVALPKQWIDQLLDSLRDFRTLVYHVCSISAVETQVVLTARLRSSLQR